MKIVLIFLIYLIKTTNTQDADSTQDKPDNQTTNTQDANNTQINPDNQTTKKIDDKQIQQSSQILIGVQSKQISFDSKCQGYHIGTNYKNVKLNLAKMTGFDKLIFTDQPITDCSEKCDPLAQICQSI
jgi:hypothetical protein